MKTQLFTLGLACLLSLTAIAAPKNDPSHNQTIPDITSVQLVSGFDFAPLQQVSDGTELVLQDLPDAVNFEAISADPAITGSIQFVLEGPVSVTHTDNDPIYTLADDFSSFDLTQNALPEGNYVLTVTPYAKYNAKGKSGNALTVRFSVSTDTPAEPISAVPAIDSLWVVSADYTRLQALSDGGTIKLADMPELINIEAVSADADNTGSVAFVLEGPAPISRTENDAIYTLQSTQYNLNTTTGDLPAGDYTLSVTPYAGMDATGEAGATLTASFTVDATETPEEVAPPESSVPGVSAVQVLGYSLSGEATVLKALNNGGNIDLAQMPQHINLEAVSLDSSKTGSVAFDLQGPRHLSRIENTAIYTLENSYYNFDVTANDLPAGDYTLSVTPYAGMDASGEAGTTHVTQFAVTGAAVMPAVEPPVANDDSYSGKVNQTLTVTSNIGVMSNDSGEALTEVELATLPNHGSLELDYDGGFHYTPNHNFNGIDQFSYSLHDNYGNQDTATVTLTTVGTTADNNGFTPIVASADTRTIYVSSSEGLDSNDGLRITSPVKTLNKAFELARAGYPDHVLLKRGDVWVDERLDNAKSGRSKSEPAVIAFYGDWGDRPKLKTSGYSFSSYALDYVNILGLEIEAYKLNPADPAFDGTTSANIRLIGEFKNILFEDMKLRFVEFIVQGYDGKAPRDFRIRRSMILDKYSPGTSYTKNSRPSGIYTDNGDGLIIEENLWDHNGWSAVVPGAGANMYNHNMYVSERNNVGNKVVIRNNIITRASSHGIHGRPGGLYENNFFGRNAISLQMGYRGSDNTLASTTFAYARDNVITEGVNMKRGIDACSDSSLCTHAIWGIELDNLGGADVHVERNIVANRQWDYGHVSGIRHQDAAQYSDNIIYKWDSEAQGTDKGYPDPGRTLADYNASLGGERSFEAFIEAARSRGLQEWDERYTAAAINEYIRAGFGR